MLPRWFDADDPAIAVLIDGEPALLVEREPVRAGLAIFADVEPAVAALRAKDGHLAVRRPAVDRVVVRIAEEQITGHGLLPRHPHRSLGEKKPTGELFESGVRGEDLIQRRVGFENLGPDELRRADRVRHVELEGGRPDPDKVPWRIGQRPIDADHRHRLDRTSQSFPES